MPCYRRACQQTALGHVYAFKQHTRECSPVQDDRARGHPRKQRHAIDAGHARMLAGDLAAGCSNKPHPNEGNNAVPVIGHIVVDCQACSAVTMPGVTPALHRLILSKLQHRLRCT